jgi:hypothetical protein
MPEGPGEYKLWPVFGNDGKKSNLRSGGPVRLAAFFFFFYNPEGWFKNSQGILCLRASQAARAFTPNVSVA